MAGEADRLKVEAYLEGFSELLGGVHSQFV